MGRMPTVASTNSKARSRLLASENYRVVHEYDYLVTRRVSREACHVISHDDFGALRDFVLGNLEGDEAVELMRLCSPAGVGEALQLRNYVGVIELESGLQVEVLPKIDFGTDEESRSVFLRMLADLGTDTSFRSMNRAHVSDDRTPLFEAFVSMFLEECSNLIKRGIKSTYKEVRSRESVMRGRIDFARQTREGLVHAERLSLVYDEYVIDRPENRIMKSTLRLLKNRSRSAGNKRRATQLFEALDGVSLSHNVDADFSRCVIDRTTREYETLLAWCRVFLKGESFSMFRGRNVAMALLFPMEKVFEGYVGKTLRKIALQANALRSVELQARGKWLFNDRGIALRPDILCVNNSGSNVVLDTKWKRVNGVRDLGVADMYQMYAYGRRFRKGHNDMQHVILLYPWHKGVRRSGLLRSGKRVSPDGVQVDMFYVDLRKIDESMNMLIALLDDPKLLEG